MTRSWGARRESGLRWTWLESGKQDVSCLRLADRTRFALVTSAILGLTTPNGGPLGEPGKGRSLWIRVGFSDDTSGAFIFFVVRQDKEGLGGLLLAVLSSCPLRPPEGLLDLAEQRLADAPGGW